jgi:protein ImuB
MVSVSSDRRILVIHFPRLATDRLQRRRRPSYPSSVQAELPLIVTTKAKGALVIAALDVAASQAGLGVGMALATARALQPALAIAEHDPAADQTLLERIADWTERYTPCVGLVARDGLALDITGAAHLMGGEECLLSDCLSRLNTQGFSATAAIAGTLEAARALTLFGEGGIIVPGREIEATADLPLAALGIEDTLVIALARLGLKRIDDLAGHPRAPLAARFGRDLLDRLDRVRGLADSSISPRRPMPAYIAERRFAEPIGHEEDIHRTILTLAADLARLLERQGEGARRLELAFFRADGTMRRLSVETARPLRDPKAVMRLFRERLDALADPLDPGFGFDVIRLSSPITEPNIAHEPDFNGQNDLAEDIAALVERLGARLSPSRVMRIQPQDTHLPERATRFLPAQNGNAALAVDWDVWREPEGAPTRPIRLLEQAEPIEVIAEVPDGPPIRFRWRRVFHVVVKAEGPERIAPEWWRTTGQTLPPTRDYFRIEDENGARFWVFRAGLFGRENETPGWFMHGLFG